MRWLEPVTSLTAPINFSLICIVLPSKTLLVC
jgi:hypothetical protein